MECVTGNDPWAKKKKRGPKAKGQGAESKGTRVLVLVWFVRLRTQKKKQWSRPGHGQCFFLCSCEPIRRCDNPRPNGKRCCQPPGSVTVGFGPVNKLPSQPWRTLNTNGHDPSQEGVICSLLIKKKKIFSCDNDSNQYKKIIERAKDARVPSDSSSLCCPCCSTQRKKKGRIQ